MLQNSIVKLKKISILGMITLSSIAYSAITSAIAPTPAMLEQLQRLSPAEQQRLMKQYGISPGALGASSSQATPLETPEIITPRVDYSAVPPKTLPNGQQNSNKLKPYGYDMFSGQPSTFAPVSDIPVPAQYLMGPGDVVNVQIYGKENQRYSLTVSRNGSIEMPDMGPVSVMGLTFSELQLQLSEKINEQHIGVQSSISLGELRSIRVIIAGEAFKPGSYTVSSLSTITQALFISGGVTDIASLRNIQLKRAGVNITTFDLYDLLMKGDASNDLRLQSGDVIFIPTVGATASVTGEVRRPAIYELKGEQSAEQLIRLAAGVKANSYPKASIIESYSNNLPTLVNVDLTSTKGKKYRIKDGDILNVQSTSDVIEEHIVLAGAVTRPGFYQWRNGMRVSDLINSQWSDLTDSVDLKYSLIVREINVQGDIETLHFSLADVLRDNRSTANIVLKPRDKLVVFNQNEQMLTEQELAAKQEQQELEKEQVLEQQRLIASGKLTTEQAYALSLQKSEQIEEKVNLSEIYTSKLLLEKSAEYSRRELLAPIIDKLKGQEMLNGAARTAFVSGEVRYRGEYPISQNFRLSDLITAAGGLKESAYVKQAELTSVMVHESIGAMVEHRAVNLVQALKKNKKEDLLIQSKDQLNILKIPSWQENLTVTLKGEVKFPGTYFVRQGETLESVVTRAGGYTNQAFLTGAVFTRESVKEQELKQIVKLADQLRLDIAAKGLSSEGTSVPFSEASLMLKELENLKAVGRMVLELNSKSSNDNQLVLENGDMLIIPSKQQTVTVVGEVQHASTHFFKQSLDVEEYISLAGGAKQRADEGRIYIIRANGSVMLPQENYWFDNNQHISAGDTIVVPLDTEYKDNLTLWSQVTSIIYNAAVAVAAVNGI